MESSEVGAAPTLEQLVEQLPDRVLAFHSALQTEHFVLGARGRTVSESSSRASIYLAMLSSSLVAFGFLASTRYAEEFLATVLPVVFILGLFTYERLVQTSLEDVAALAAIQRIRQYYATLLPEGDVFFPRPGGVVPNEMLDIGQRGYRRGVFFTMSSAVGVVNAVVGAAGVTAAVHTLLADFTWALSIGASSASALILLQGLYQERRYARLRTLLTTQGTSL